MRIRKLYLSSDGREFSTRIQAVSYERMINYDRRQEERRIRLEAIR